MKKCVIIDDEPLALDVLETFVERTGQLSLAGRFDCPLKAFQFLQKNIVDLVIVDIEMPGMDGLELIRTLKYPVRIVITTAYRDYAVDGFDLAVTDYLVKPILFERFMRAIYKCNFTSAFDPGKTDSPNDFLPVKVDKKIIRIPFREILWIEAMKDYVKIQTSECKYITYQTLSGVLEKLPTELFIRIHKSYVVGTLHVKAIQGNEVELNKNSIPIGRTYRQTIMQSFLKTSQTT